MRTMESLTFGWVRRRARVCAAVGLVALVAGCGGGGARDATSASGERVAQPTDTPRVEDMSWGPVELSMTVDPPAVSYERDVMLTLRITAPESVDVPFPFLADRLQGFVLNGTFEGEPVQHDEKVTRELHARLTPTPSQEFRIAPMAVRYTDKRVHPPREGWFPTRPIVFDVVPPAPDETGSTVSAELTPAWIPPPPARVAMYVLAVLVVIALAIAAFKLVGRVRREVQLRRMSPRERALHELEALLAKGLVESNQAKEFYCELTMIVRAYIERQHGVRAPEQTTEEFLAAVAGDPRFSAGVVRKLKEFLQAADLVKFAAYMPDSDAVDASVGTARTYIDSDAREADALRAADAGGRSSAGEKKTGG